MELESIVRTSSVETSFINNKLITKLVKEEEKEKKADLWKKKVVVVISSVTLAMEGVNLSLAGPFFPEKGTEKGLSQTQIGFVIGSFDLANLFFSFIVASILNPSNIKFLYCTGVLWSATGVACFAMSSEGPNEAPFFWSALASRVVNGIAASLLYGTTMPLAVQVFPERASLITTIIQISMGLGTVIGPPMGSALLPLGGFKTPFLVTSSCEFISFFLAVIFMPVRSSSNKAKVKASDYLKFFFKFSTMSVVIPSATLFFTSGLRDSAYALYFENELGLPQETIGYIFIALSISYLCSGPLVGWLVARGFGAYIIATAFVIAPISTFMLYMPCFLPALETLAWALAVLTLNGITMATLFNPSYLILEKVAVNQGYMDSQQRKTIAASCFNVIAASGRTIGSYFFGGYLNDNIGFYNTCLIYACILVVTGIWNLLFLFSNGLLGRIYYLPAETSSDVVLSLTNSATHSF